jgi:hypothetical protein
MPQDFAPGDFLVFQLESGYGLLRVLAVDGDESDPVWHLAAYRDLFLDVDSAEQAVNDNKLTVELPHVALTNRAFESTQVARITSAPLDARHSESVARWHAEPDGQVHDRSIRLLLGLR